MSRGTRNNNPGNIRVGTKWQGLAARHEMTAEQKREKAFCVFRAPEWGIRAIVRILQTYERKYSIDTVRGIIERWAPPIENNTPSYVRAVSSALGVEPDTPLTFGSRTLMLLVKAIIQHENGEQPYRNETILTGIVLAKVKAPKPKPLIASKRLKGGALVGGAVTVLTQSEQVVELARSTVSMIFPNVAVADSGWYFVAVLGAALASFGFYIGWTILIDYMDRREPELVEK